MFKDEEKGEGGRVMDGKKGEGLGMEKKGKVKSGKKSVMGGKNGKG